MTGTSIGAINAGIIAGSTLADLIDFDLVNAGATRLTIGASSG